MRHVLRARSIVLDIGTNIGRDTLFFVQAIGRKGGDRQVKGTHLGSGLGPTWVLEGLAARETHSKGLARPQKPPSVLHRSRFSFFARDFGYFSAGLADGVFLARFVFIDSRKR